MNWEVEDVMRLYCYTLCCSYLESKLIDISKVTQWFNKGGLYENGKKGIAGGNINWCSLYGK